jgi:hypothetical protein
MQRIFNKDGFNWWIGVVEDRNDPEKLGRCKVRIFGYHTDSKVLLPTTDLPWAIPILPITSASTSGIGQAPIGPVTGTWVIGFFLDGEDMQQPAFFGTIGTKTAQTTFAAADVKPEVQNRNDGFLKDSDGNQVLDGAGTPVKAGTPPVEGWELGQTSETYESAGRGPGTINNYQSSEDRGGASYGTYQLASYLPATTPSGKARPSSKNSPVLSYLRSSKFSSFFEGLTPGTSAFDSQWTQIASSQRDAFEKDQHDYIKRSYYDVMVANLARSGLDLSSFGPAVQDLIWSTAVQFGPARTSIFTEPLKGKSKLTDSDIVNLVSEYKIANVDTFFRSSGTAIIAGVRSRYTNEKNDLLSLVTA